MKNSTNQSIFTRKCSLIFQENVSLRNELLPPNISDSFRFSTLKLHPKIDSINSFFTRIIKVTDFKDVFCHFHQTKVGLFYHYISLAELILLPNCFFTHCTLSWSSFFAIVQTYRQVAPPVLWWEKTARKKRIAFHHPA